MRNYSQCTISILQTTNSEKNLDWIVSENAGATRILRSTRLYSLWNTLYRYVTLIHFYQIIDEIISEVQFKIQLKIYTAKSPSIISGGISGKRSHMKALNVSQILKKYIFHLGIPQ
jgi:hypothetical protein